MKQKLNHPPLRARSSCLARILTIHMLEPTCISQEIVYTAAQIIVNGDYGYLLNIAVEMRSPLLAVFPDARKVYPSMTGEGLETPEMMAEATRPIEEIASVNVWKGILGITKPPFVTPPPKPV